MTSICVDRYRASVEGIQTRQTLSQRVLDASETVYTFRFPVDLCRDMLSPAITVSAAAITDGVVGPSITGQGPVDNLNRSGKQNTVKIVTVKEHNSIAETCHNHFADLIRAVFPSQLFTADGIRLTLINDVRVEKLV